MKQDEDRAMGQFRRMLAGLYLLKYCLATLTVWAFLYGTAVLALRGAVGLSRLDLVWGLLTLPVALAPAVVLALRRLPGAEAVRALIDRHSRAGGLVMAGAEQELGPWQDHLPRLRQPVLRWRGGKVWGLLVIGLAFVALGFLVPQGFADMGAGRLDVNKEVDRLQEQIGVLKDEKVIGQERAEALSEKLNQLRRDTSARDPVKTLESLDHVQETASKAAQDAAESATRKAEQVARAEKLAEIMEKLSGKIDQQMLTDAMNEMAALAKKAATENELLESGLDGETLEALKKGKLSPEQMKKLAEALKNGKAGLNQKVGRLVKAKLLDADALQKCEGAGKCDCAGLAAFLKENGASTELADLIAQSEEPGEGGVTRGPGPAKLTFGDESSEEGVKFKEEELPPAALQQLKESQLSGLSSGAPQVGKEKPGPAGSGALAGSKSGGGSASTQMLLPRHRGAVQRYFDRPTTTPKK